MKKSIISGVVGIIFGFVACIMTIYSILHKICKVPVVKDEIGNSIKNLITVLLFGEKRVSYTPVYKGHGRYPVYDYKNFDDDYRRSVKSTIESITFDTLQDANNTLAAIRNTIKIHGYISVSSVYGLITEKTGVPFIGKYMDTKYGWYDGTEFVTNNISSKIYVMSLPIKIQETNKEELA